MLKQFLKTNPQLWSTLPLRAALGIIFMAHGGQKLFGWFDGPGLAKLAEGFGQMGFIPGPFWAGLVAGGEFFGGLILLLGLFTRLGALNLVVIMLVAMFKVHWGQFFLPHGIEYTVTLSLMALSLLISGGGAASLDALLTAKKGCCEHSYSPATPV